MPPTGALAPPDAVAGGGGDEAAPASLTRDKLLPIAAAAAVSAAAGNVAGIPGNTGIALFWPLSMSFSERTDTIAAPPVGDELLRGADAADKGVDNLSEVAGIQEEADIAALEFPLVTVEAKCACRTLYRLWKSA